MNYIDTAREMLKGWIGYSIKDLYVCPDRSDLVCYGAGYNGWGMQTHQKALAAFAVAAVSKDIETEDIGISKKELLDYSLKMLRYMLESHIEGSFECAEGDKWGHTWISVLGTERAVCAVEALEEHMTQSDKKLLRKVFVSEADWIMDFYDIKADPRASTGGNKPESNIWNGAFLHRVAMMYPDCERAEEYKEKGTKYLVNGISVSSDKMSDKVYDGKTVSQWYVGNNFFDSYSLDHHGYLNTGYMVICLSNIAMLHFSYKKKGVKAPEALYHHALELWMLIKTFMFDDGRLIRIGGDSRVRYCYCQDYVLPMLMFVRDYFGDDDAIKLERALVNLFYKEYNYNGNGSFLSKRCEGFKEISPIYYTRLESDKASVLAMLLDWEKLADTGNKSIASLTSWSEKYHGACVVNGKNRFASWVWSGAEGAQGLCLPKGKSNLAEWRDNLAGEIKGTGCVNETECVFHAENEFDGGFLAFGIARRVSEKFIAEQQKDEITAVEKITYAVLPDDATVVVMQYAKTGQRIYLKTVKGINYNIPNDVYNNFTRTYYFNDSENVLKGLSGKEEVTDTFGSWVNVDNTLGIIKGYGQSNIKIYHPGKRQIGIKITKHSDNYYNEKTQSLWADAICGKCEIKPHWADKNEVILDEGAIIVAGIDAKATKEKSESNVDIWVSPEKDIRSITAYGEDGKIYIVLANFGDNEQSINITADEYNLKSAVSGYAYKGIVRLAENSAEIIVADKK